MVEWFPTALPLVGVLLGRPLFCRGTRPGGHRETQGAGGRGRKEDQEKGGGGGGRPKGAGTRALALWDDPAVWWQSGRAHSGGEGNAAPFGGRAGEGGRAKLTLGGALAYSGEGDTQW